MGCIHDPEKMACKGAPTITVHTGSGDMEECQACGDAVAWDLVDHPLFGFKSCAHAKDKPVGPDQGRKPNLSEVPLL